MAEDPRIVLSIDDAGVADVRLNRADKMNALDAAMFKALVDTSDELAKNTSVRCAVLSGEGRSFCAGLDFGNFQGMANAAPRKETPSEPKSAIELEHGRITHHAQQSVYGWTELPVPVIAALHGHALGGGIQLALGADIRIAGPDTKMSVLEIRWGLIPDMTGTQSLIDLVGIDVAKDLTFSGRMVGAEEAKDLGLVTHLSDDPLATAHEMAAEIAQKSPHAIRAAKRLFRQAPKISTAEGFALERQEIGQLIGSANQKESVMAFFEKRPAAFADPSD